MFKYSVIIIHAIIFIFVTILALGGQFNLASPDPEANYTLWYSTLGIYNLLVIVSAFVQVKVKNLWVFVLSIISLSALLFVTLQYIYPYLFEMLHG